MLPAVPAVRRFILGTLGLALCAGMAARAAVNPPPTQLFYVPFPEDQQLAAFDAINTDANDPITVFVTLAAATDGTVIYYDHWEDGYEKDITNPTQSTTLIFGDGNSANGYPPGNPADLIPAGTVFNLRNFVATATLQSVVDYDARDKIASFKPISVTKTTVPAGTNTLLAGCTEVFERGLWGTEYRSPVGVDMPTSTPTATLTQDENLFSYTALAISAGPGGASVQIDKDNNGVFEETVTLAEGEAVFRTAVNVGGHVLADKPVQVVLFTGTIDSNYASRDTSLLPTYRWSNDYFAPVSTRTNPADGTVTFLYNPGATAITVNYDYRSSTSAYTTASISVPAKGNARVTLQPANGTNHFGAYRFYTTGATPPVFYAVSAIDADSTSGNNQAWDGGFTLVGRPSLTTQVLLSLGIGRDPYSTTNLTENGNPLWITTSGNGHTPETVYVDYNGDNVGPLTDPNGNRYDVAYSLRELEQKKIFDPDGDQSGMLVYTLNPAVRIAAAWGQDPAVATTGQPGLDVASLVPPMREGDGGKRSSIAVDADGDGEVSCGDTLEYDIRGISNARTNIPGPFAVQDNLPSTVTYVPGTTRYRFMVGGAWQAWTTIPDNTTGTPFPLDVAGFSVPGNLAAGQQFQVTFRATIVPRASLTGSTIENTGQVEISPYGLLLPISWTDTVYGSIGDRVWSDLDGDGVQDAGENGIPNIDVYLDYDNDGVRDANEPLRTTDASGNYLFAGLAAGTYTVRVDHTDIAAANVGYGPTFDVDGIATSHRASVTLGIAEDRVDVDFGYRVGASVGDRVWMDRDNDGVQENGEPGINGVRVYLDLDSDGIYDANEPNTITAGDGTWYIGNLNAGTYLVRIDTTTLPVGATQTFDRDGTGTAHRASVTLLGAEHRADLDFGYFGAYSIGDLVWEDTDANGIFTTVSTVRNVYNGLIDISQNGSGGNEDDGTFGGYVVSNGRIDVSGNGSIGNEDDGTLFGINIVNGYFDISGNGNNGNDDDGTATYTVSEAFIANVRVYLDMDGDGIFDATEPSAVTNSSGAYSIGNLFNGTYTVRVDTSTVPSSYVQTYDLTSPSTDHTATVVVSGANRTDVDFGYRNDASLGDLVWNDRDADGVRDAGEPGIPGVWVFIDADDDNVFDQGIERYAITDLNGLYRFENLAAGTYIVRIDISTLPQGSTQTYDRDATLDHETSRTLTTSQEATDVDFGYRATASFGDRVWNDSNGNGLQDVSETGIANVRVYADINGNGTYDSATEPTALTDSNGAYLIGNLVPGTYTARIDASTLPAGMTQTFDATGGLDHAATFTLSATQARTEIDFGYTSPVSLGDLVWNDVNGDGQKGASETGIAGVTVTLYRAANDTIAGTTTTNASGLYSFTGLMPGSYYVIFDPVAGYLRSLADQGADASDSDANAAGRTPSVTLLGGQSDLTLDAGYFQPGTITGTVYADTNNDNVGDVGIPNVVLTLKDSSGNDIDSDPNTSGTQPTTTTTNASGVYTFANLTPGSYQVVQTQPAGYLTVTDGDTTTPGDDAANASTTDNMIPVSVAANETDTGNDFVEEQPGTISGTVWADTNNDNVGDVGIPNVVLTLKDGSGNDIDSDPVTTGTQPTTTTTNGSGVYTFSNLPPGSYRVVQTQPAGYLTVTDGDTTTPGDDAANASTTDNMIPVSVNANETDNGNDFVEEQPGTISGTVWADTNNDNTGDVGIVGVTLTLFTDPNGDGNPADGTQYGATTATITGGTYSFTDLPPGAYVVIQTQPIGYLTVTDGDTTNASDDAANTSTTDNRIPVAVTANETDTGNDFVEEQPGTISGTVWADTNNDNIGDTGIVGVVITLKDSSGNDIDSDPNASGTQPTITTTGAGGTYSFTNLPPGSYRVVETQPSGYLNVSDTDGSNNNVIGDQAPILVVAGQTNAGNDFVEEQPGTIRGSVFADTDGDGDGDAPLENVLIHLLDAAGNPVDGDPVASGIQAVTTLTLADGSYSFGGLAPGNYRVREDQPAGYNSVSDTDGSNNNIIGDQIPIQVTAGGTSSGHDFIEIEPASIAGHVFADSDNNGSGDTPLSGVTVTLLNGSGTPVASTVTLADGSYLFANLPPGTYRVSQAQPPGYASVSDVDGANNNLIGDETPIVLLPGDDVTGRDFVEVEYGSIAGSVRDDTDDNGSGDTPLAGVTLALLDASGQPVLDGSNQPVTTVTAMDGTYYFGNLLPGSYQVAETQPTGYGSVSDIDGGDLDLIGNVTAIAVAPGQDVTGRDFVEIRLGAISGSVFAGTDPLGGVTLALLDENGDPVLDGNGDPITTITGPDGSYRFEGVFPGTYQVAQTQPDGYDSFGDADGGDINLIGDVAPIVVLPGQTNEDNNFIETLDTCANDWPEWLDLHPGETASGNPDGDVLDNLAEFAFARPHDSGAGSAFCIHPSTVAPGTIEGGFVRPKQATDHVTYVLEYTASLGTPTVWQSIVLEPGDLVVTDNGDCTESVDIFDLEGLTGLVGGEGFIRLRADLDEDGDETIDHVSHTPVEGWTRTPVAVSCRTYNNPYLHCAAFTGVIDSATGSTLTLTTSAGTVDLATLLDSGVSYYAEITSGENEGHRFDVISATGDTVTVANDADLASGLAPFNTLTGTLPVTLAGDGIVIRPHWTIDELFPPDQFGATGSQSTADQVQVNNAGVWTIYWLYDDGSTSPRWVKDATLADEGGAVLPPGQGVFFNSRLTTGSVLAWGEVRSNDFIRPLPQGSSLVGGGYPLDQSSMGGRAMTLAQGFFGSRDFKKADRFYIWKGDAVTAATGYDGYFLLNGAPVQPSLIQWTRTGDTTIQSYNSALLFQGDRAVFMDLANPVFTYEMPTPWTP